MRWRRLWTRLSLAALTLLLIHLIHHHFSFFLNFENISAVKFGLKERLRSSTRRQTILVNQTSQLRWVLDYLRQSHQRLQCVNEGGQLEPCERILARIVSRDHRVPRRTSLEERRHHGVSTPKSRSTIITTMSPSTIHRMAREEISNPPGPFPSLTSLKSSTTTSSALPSSSSPSPYPTLMEPTSCAAIDATSPLNTVIAVKTVANDSHVREAIRQTWASLRVWENHHFRFVFSCGTSSKDNAQAAALRAKLTAEATLHGDLLVGSYEDVGRSETWKAMTAIDWIARRCRRSARVVMTTDHIFLHLFTLRQFLDSVGDDGATSVLASPPSSPHAPVFACHVNKHAPVIRTPGSPWRVTKEEYPAHFYPTFCDSDFYLFEAKHAPALVEAASRRPSPAFFISDVFVTGILGADLGAAHRSLPPHFGLKRDLGRSERFSPRGPTFIAGQLFPSAFYVIYNFWNDAIPTSEMRRRLTRTFEAKRKPREAPAFLHDARDKCAPMFEEEPPDVALASRQNTSVAAAPAKVALIVLSAIKNLERRRTIRATWGSSGAAKMRGVITALVFLLGSPDRGDQAWQKRIDEEAREFGDVVQQPFLDSYMNLTAKTLMGFQWASLFCGGVDWVFKIDDDMFLNVFYLGSLLDEFQLRKAKVDHAPSVAPVAREYHVICVVNRTPKVPRYASDRYAKWRTTFREYGESRFPTYCDGPGYMMDAELAKEIFNVTRRMDWFWLEDVFVTGIATRELSRQHGPSDFHLRFHDVTDRYFRHSAKKWRAKLMIQHIRQKKNFLMGPVDSDATMRRAWAELSQIKRGNS